MVKKIDGTRPPSLTGSQPVEAGKAVEATKISSVGQVGATQGQAPARAVRRPTRAMTVAEREHLFRLIHEEADKMFGQDGLPAEKRKSVESAVKMALDASMLEEEETK